MASDALAQTGNLGYTKVKEIEVALSGTIRVLFTLWDTLGILNAFGKIYIDGVAVGTERQCSSPTTYTEDIDVYTGELVQIYAHISAGGGAASVTNFKINGDITSYYGRVII